MNESRLVKGRVSILSARQYKLSYLELEWLVEQLISSQYYLFVQIIMYMETEFTKGSSLSSAPSPLPSAPPQNDDHFNYHTVPPPVPTNIELITTGIPVMNSSIQPPIPWSTGLCHCYDDPCICCLTCWCPCVTFGRIAEITDKGSIWCGLSGTLFTILLVTGCSFWYSCCYRSKLRAQYSLEESPCLDCCVHFCCQSCALCQEYRELKKRGFDLSIGWQKNVERQIRGASVHPPIVQQPMHR